MNIGFLKVQIHCLLGFFIHDYFSRCGKSTQNSQNVHTVKLGIFKIILQIYTCKMFFHNPQQYFIDFVQQFRFSTAKKRYIL